MRITRSIGTTLAAATVALAAPAAAHAASYTVWGGAAGPAPKGVPMMASLPQFIPAKLQVHVGDSVTFKSSGFTTVTFLGSTKLEKLAIITPKKGATYSGLTDSAGANFYFDGLPAFQYNARSFGPAGSTKIGDHTSLHSSGVLSPKGATFTFTKAGTYRYVNLVAPAMAGSITVKPAAAHVPSMKAVAAASAKVQAAGFKQAKLLAARKAPANTVYVGLGAKGANLLAFQPDALSVKAGTTVHFVAGDPFEVHNVVFGPRKWATDFIAKTDLFPETPKGANQVTPVDIYGTDPAPAGGAPYVYSATAHGNGFWASPVVDLDKATPFGASFDVTFPTAGTFPYFCAIHGVMMSGTVTVTA